MIGAAIVTIIFVICLFCIAWPLGEYIARVIEDPDRFCWLRPLRWIERGIGSLLGGVYRASMGWKEYFFSLFAFSMVSIFCFYLFLRLYLPTDTAFNFAISFVSNTNWQSCVPEIDLDYVVHMVGVTTQQFLSASVGFSLLCAFSRGFVNQGQAVLGNFWRDVVRFSLYVLMPVDTVFALLLVATGVPQSIKGEVQYTTLEQVETKIPIGMYASQVAIKQLGSNGGGVFRANGAHPLENPSPWSNLIELAGILLVPLALCRTFGEFVRAPRQGFMIASVMAILFIGAVIFACLAESRQLPFLPDQERSLFCAEGNMEGKECRFGPFWSVLWAVATTAVANGSVNCALSSLLPLAGGVSLAMMQLGEVVFGGLGTGVVGAVIFLLLAVFSAGLMVGRTPEFLGKKIEAKEMRLVLLLALLPSILVLIFLSVVLLLPEGRGALSSHGPHAMTEGLYAFSSAAANNGSSFQGLQADIPLYNTLLGIVMFVTRYFSAAIILALAATLSRKKKVASGAGTLPTDSFAFGLWFGFVILILGALNFLPAFTLGPIVEHVMLFVPIQRP